MKRILLILTTVAITQVAFAQHDAGDKNLNIGIGLGSTFADGDGGVPPLSASFEVGIKDEISVGGFAGFSTSEFDTFGGTWTYTYILVGARGSYHYDFLGNPKIDTYGGLMLGYNIASAKWDGGGNPNASVGGLLLGGYVGGRYAIKDNLGAYAELGYGIAYLNIGVNLKL